MTRPLGSKAEMRAGHLQALEHFWGVIRGESAVVVKNMKKNGIKDGNNGNKC